MDYKANGQHHIDPHKQRTEKPKKTKNYIEVSWALSHVARFGLLFMTRVTFFKQKKLLNYNSALLIVFIKVFFSIGSNNIWLAKTTTPLQVFCDAYMSSSFVTLLSIVPFQHLG